MVIWKSEQSDEIKRNFFQAAVVSIILNGCTTWTLAKRIEKLDGNCTMMLRAILKNSWKKHSTKLQLYGHLPPISKTIQIRRARQARHCWRSKNELISDVLMWNLSHGRPTRTYHQQFSKDTGYSLEDLPGAMDDRDGWRERVREIRVSMMMIMWVYYFQIWNKKEHYIIISRIISIYAGLMCIETLYFYLIQIICLAQSAGAIEYTDCFSAEGQDPLQRVSWVWHKTIWWWGSSNVGALGNAEFPGIIIAPRSTLARSSSTL